MSRVRSIKGARKLRTFAQNTVVNVASEEDWEACFTRARDRLVVVEFSASFSLPCKAMAPYITALSQQPEYRVVQFVRVTLDSCPELGAKHGVQSAPTYQLWRSGKMLETLQGAVPQKLMELLSKHKGSSPSGRISGKLVALACVLVVAVATAVASSRRGRQPKMAQQAFDGAEGNLASDIADIRSVGNAARAPPLRKEATGPQ